MGKGRERGEKEVDGCGIDFLLHNDNDSNRFSYDCQRRADIVPGARTRIGSSAREIAPGGVRGAFSRRRW